MADYYESAGRGPRRQRRRDQEGIPQAQPQDTTPTSRARNSRTSSRKSTTPTKCCPIRTSASMYRFAGVDPNDPNAGGMPGGFSAAGFGDMGDVFTTFTGGPRSAVAHGGPAPRTQPGRDALGHGDHRLEDGGVRRHRACRRSKRSVPVPGVRRHRLPRAAPSRSPCPDCHGQGLTHSASCAPCSAR